jgi:hypothetical protein
MLAIGCFSLSWIVFNIKFLNRFRNDGQYQPTDYTNLPYIQQTTKANSIHELNTSNASDETASESTTSSKSKLKRKMLLNKPLVTDNKNNTRLTLKPQVNQIHKQPASSDNQDSIRSTNYQYV